MNLKGLSVRELEEFARSIGEQAYRGRQLFDWIYRKRASGFAGMSDLPAALRSRLGSEASLGGIVLKDSVHSPADGTTKLLFGLEDGRQVESVLIPPRTAFVGSGQAEDGGPRDSSERLTLCVSTQVGCPLDCVFCATATMGFLRNLTAGEIVDQVMAAGAEAGRKITNVVYMGMGEPLLNYDEVMRSAEIIAAGLGIAARRITVSTAGWVPGIRRMADEKRKVRLAISLHSLDERSRRDLMPVAKKYPLPELLDAAAYYYARTKDRITFEYILFEGWNDSDADARKLAALVKRIPGKVNLIPYHSIEFSLPPAGAAAPAGAGSGPAAAVRRALRPAGADRIDAFANRLRALHVTAFVRSSAGEDINAACGQLAVRHARRPRSVTTVSR